MSYIKQYKRLNRFLLNESFEPMLSWGLRMGISATVPFLWGLATGHVADAVWITLAAEAMCWVELKGPFSWQLRTLVTGAALALICSALGAVSGNNLWLSALLMLPI